MTTSAHSWKNFKIANEKLKQEILLCSRFCHGDWWWSECWYSIGSCSTLWRASWGFCARLFRNHQNNMDLVLKSFYCSCRESCIMHTRWSTFQTILGQNTFSKLIQFAIFGCNTIVAWRTAWVPERFFPGRDHHWIFTKFFLGEVKSGEIWFFLLETRKQPFVLKFSKSKRARDAHV